MNPTPPAARATPASATLPEPQIVTLATGRRLRYRITRPDDDSGTSVLMIHGIGCSLEDFDEQQRLLGGGVRTCAVDLPGFGGSDRLPVRTTLAGLAETLLAATDAIGLDGPLHLVGNSLGGAVAMQMAVSAPDRVASLLLIDPTGFGRTVTWALRALAVPGVAPAALVPNAARARRTLRGVFHDPALVTPARVAVTLRRAGAPHRAEVFVELLDSLGTWRGVRAAWRHQLLSALAPLQIPTLVVWGRHDAVLPVSHLAAVARTLPHASTRVIDGAGHMPQIERPQEVADLARAFWASVQPGVRRAPTAPPR